MATIRKRNGKFEVQVRRTGPTSPLAELHRAERRAAMGTADGGPGDRQDLPAAADRRALSVTLGELVGRYRDTVTVGKRGRHIERVVLNAFALHPICRKTLAQLRTADFAAYRDDRLKEIKPASLKRQLGPIDNLFEIARDEWGIGTPTIWFTNKV